MLVKNVSNGMELRIYDSRLEMGAAAAAKFVKEARQILEQQDELNVIFAAAPSQNEMLAALHESDLPWQRINAFHMDEYIGLSPEASQGFGNFLRDRLFQRFPFKSVHYLNGNAESPVDECRRYAALLRDAPVDIVCLGIGENGHLAFNDPPVADFNDQEVVKVVELDMVCRQQQVNDGCFKELEEVPTHALTLTIPALLKAGVINGVIPGPAKARAIYQMVNAKISTENPATILRNHPQVTLFLDRESSGLLEL